MELWETEMGWNSLFKNSPLPSLEKLKNIKAKLFFLLAPEEQLSRLPPASLEQVLQQLSKGLIYHASQFIRWAHFLLEYRNEKTHRLQILFKNFSLEDFSFTKPNVTSDFTKRISGVLYYSAIVKSQWEMRTCVRMIASNRNIDDRT